MPFSYFLGGEWILSWQVIQYMDDNPQATVKDIIEHFAIELEVDTQLECLKREVDDTIRIREQLRPLYGKKAESDNQLALIDSELDMQVMIKYPPRQGTDKDRKAYKKELQSNHPDYTSIAHQVDTYKEELQQFENQMSDVQQRAKNARRIMETFNHYVSFALEVNKSAGFGTMGAISVTPSINAKAANANMF